MVGQGKGGDGHAVFTHKVLLLELLIMSQSSEVNSLYRSSTSGGEKKLDPAHLPNFKRARTHEAFWVGQIKSASR